MDEVIFKMYATNQSSWEADGVEKISHKGDGKGNLKVVFVDEVTGLVGKNITVEQWEQFNEKRNKDHEFNNPILVHWEYRKAGAAQGMGYWTNADME